MRAIRWDPRLALIGLLVLVSALSVRRLDREIVFYDEAVYVASAHALASGAGYRNPSLPGSPPQAKYPPGTSLLLSAVWQVFPAFPDNLPVMKALVLLGALGTIVLTWAWVRGRRRGGSLDALAVAAFVGCSPFFLVFSTLATSDIPYAFLSLAAVYVHERGRGPRTLLAVLALAALAFLTRTAGVFLFGAIVLHLLLERRIGRAAIAAAVATGIVLPWLAWTTWASAAYAEYPAGVSGNYVGYASAIPSTTAIGQLPAIVAVNLRLLLGAWGVSVLPWAPVKVAMVAVSALLTAFLLVCRPRRPSLAALYCGIYVASILVIPYPDTARYSLPILPFLIAWTVGGLRALARGRVWGTAVLVALVAAAVAADARIAMRARGDTATRTEFHAMADWITAELPGDAILVGAWDGGYHLFTGRRAIRVSVIDTPRTYYADAVPTEFPQARELADAFQRMGACYFVRDTMMGGVEDVFFDRLMSAVEAAAPRAFEPVYVSASGRFAIRRRGDCPAPRS